MIVFRVAALISANSERAQRGPIRALVLTPRPERQTAFWEHLAEAARSCTDSDGVVRVPNECLLVAGQR